MASSRGISLDEIVAHFQDLEDPRSSVNRRHPLVAVIVIARQTHFTLNEGLNVDKAIVLLLSSFTSIVWLPLLNEKAAPSAVLFEPEDALSTKIFEPGGYLPDSSSIARGF